MAAGAVTLQSSGMVDSAVNFTYSPGFSSVGATGAGFVSVAAYHKSALATY